MLVIIFFNGFASSKIWYEYSFEGTAQLRKLDFMQQMRTIGKCITFNQPFFNLDYYDTNNENSALWKQIHRKYKPCSSNISFTRKDLDSKYICRKVHHKYSNIYHIWS